MDNNAILRRLRYVLDIDDTKMAEILELDGYDSTSEEIASMLKQEDQEGFEPCSDDILIHFLDGLIIRNRGPRDSSAPRVSTEKIDNNLILKKLRIAFNLKEEDMLSTLEKADFNISKAELTALFRKKGHRHYRECGDQFLRKFLKGLSIKE